eukprot:CAMPEP_0171676680 /NCGR_PEP_ID=MMETSP0990-20121206/54589_1 /TAXON_ID=483369 /ORGANISM="non described non described, Strain CCMP2098" /LENGTH=175 /DNA_ID=CAMNT_0012262927 /DNA_START=70 /DNA_END=597 /DNA_ORIENTATION=+
MKQALVLFLLTVANHTLGARNDEAEGHCQRFLTDPTTAPIVDNPRNLEVDNEAERWCRLVMDDNDLPQNIRGVVMEGLTHLLMKHIDQGLADRKNDAYELHQSLVTTFPDSARFLVQAAIFANEKMGRPGEAVTALKARLGDVQQKSDEEKELVAMGRRLLEHLDQPDTAASSEL